MNVKPITPEEVVDKKKNQMPNFVFEAFNELIAKNYSGNSATVKQDDAVALIMEKGDIDRQSVFDRSYLDVEDIYRDAGWKVEYDKPAYCETYAATFKFSKYVLR